MRLLSAKRSEQRSAPIQPKLFFRFCAVLSILGLARLVFFETFMASSHGHPRRIDRRYAAVRPFLTGDEPLGFLTDERFPHALESERYTQALYALAPRQLILDAPDAGLWLADLLDPASLPKLANDRGLEPTAIFDDGRLALLRRRPSP